MLETPNERSFTVESLWGRRKPHLFVWAAVRIAAFAEDMHKVAGWGRVGHKMRGGLGKVPDVKIWLSLYRHHRRIQDSIGASMFGAEADLGGLLLVAFHAGGILISLPLMLAAGGMMKEATAVQQNMITREFKDQTLSPGRQASGFMYFKIEKEQLVRIKEGILNVSVFETYSKNTSHFIIRFSHE